MTFGKGEMTTPRDFSKLAFEDFRRMATDPSLSKYERIGFPDSYRKGFEDAIFADIRAKLPILQDEKRRVLDIGPGCSDLPRMLIELCRQRGHRLTLVDNTEMLQLLPDAPFIEKVEALFPACPALIERLREQVDAILCYSALHYIVLDAGFFRFVDLSLSLLAPGGQFLIGDIPNISKRKRFFSSEAGARFHHEFMKTTEDPKVIFQQIEHDQIDDAVIFAVVQRARAAGFDAYLVPQHASLPMANRREDILITRP
jgi:hypothetical protein